MSRVLSLECCAATVVVVFARIGLSQEMPAFVCFIVVVEIERDAHCGRMQLGIGPAEPWLRNTFSTE